MVRHTYDALSMRRFLAYFYLSLSLVSATRAQPVFSVFSIIDNPPITGAGDSVQSGFIVGELPNEYGFTGGLYRSELIIQLPPLPANSKLSSAILSLYLGYASGTNGNASYGPISVYHDYSHNLVAFDSADYNATGFVLVTNAFIKPGASPGQYYPLEVTAQVAKDYAYDGSMPVSAFRFQVDGLQYDASYHYYEFYGYAYPNQLALQFTSLLSPVLACRINASDHSLTLSWPAEASDYGLEAAESLDALHWTEVTNASILNGQFEATVPSSQPQQFFRLRHN